MRPTLRRRIATDLREGILDGTYPPGSQLPHITELQEQYGAARETVRSAIAELVHSGLVSTVRAQGTFVRDTSTVNLAYRPQRGAAQIWSTQTQGHPTWNRTIASEWETATLDIADRLQIDPGSQVLYRVKHQQRGRGVAQVHEAWIPADLVTMIQQTIGDDYASVEHPPERDLYTMLRECGQAPVEVTEDVLTRMPDPEEVDTLQLPPGVPVLVTYRITRDKNGRPVETSTFTGAGDRITLSYTVPLEASVSGATQEESGPVQRDPQDVLGR